VPASVTLVECTNASAPARSRIRAHRSLRLPATCKMLGMPFNGQAGSAAPRKARITPPEETSQEAAYLKSLGEKQKPVTIKLADGEVVHGWIEYYDKNMLRLTREDGPNLFIFKHEIMYIAEDSAKRR
jgi:host factor-I protein